MQVRPSFPRNFAAAIAVLIGLASCGGGGGGGSTASTNPPAGGGAPVPGCPDLPLTPSTVDGPAWPTFAADAQRSGQAGAAAQALNRTLWRTSVDLAPQYSGTSLLAHYASPIITRKNTVLLSVKTGATDGFKIEARSGSDGSLRWSLNSDYRLPSYRWLPVFQPVLTNLGRLYVPTAGGGVLFRDDVDTARASTVCGGSQAYRFYASSADATTMNATVFTNTPITADANGNIFYGYIATGANPANVASGLARISSAGVGSWVSAAAIAADVNMTRIATNSAPALSPDGRTVYVVVTGETQAVGGIIVALDSATLAVRGRAALLDPATNSPAWISDNSTASPTVGPDGDVYFGVLEANAPLHNFRGWLLHFSADLVTRKTPGSFGWDTTASLVPASIVPNYRGTSSYLLMTKYNNYAGVSTGDGKNRVAILDPFDAQNDPINASVRAMREVLTLIGPTADSAAPGAVKEWCINSAAVDVRGRAVIVNNEDGFVYRWDLTTNTLTQKAKLDSGIAQAYTPTAVGPDGAVYAINNAVLFAIGQ